MHGVFDEHETEQNEVVVFFIMSKPLLSVTNAHKCIKAHTRNNNNT